MRCVQIVAVVGSLAMGVVAQEARSSTHRVRHRPIILPVDEKGNAKALVDGKVYEGRIHYNLNNENKVKGGFVASSAFVSDNAFIAPTAAVVDSATVESGCRVIGQAVVSGNASVEGGARVGGSSRVTGEAVVEGQSRVSGHAWVGGDAVVGGKSMIRGHFRLTEGEVEGERRSAPAPYSPIPQRRHVAALLAELNQIGQHRSGEGGRPTGFRIKSAKTIASIHEGPMLHLQSRMEYASYENSRFRYSSIFTYDYWLPLPLNVRISHGKNMFGGFSVWVKGDRDVLFRFQGDKGHYRVKPVKDLETIAFVTKEDAEKYAKKLMELLGVLNREYRLNGG